MDPAQIYFENGGSRGDQATFDPNLDKTIRHEIGHTSGLGHSTGAHATVSGAVPNSWYYLLYLLDAPTITSLEATAERRVTAGSVVVLAIATGGIWPGQAEASAAAVERLVAATRVGTTVVAYLVPAADGGLGYQLAHPDGWAVVADDQLVSLAVSDNPSPGLAGITNIADPPR